MKQELLAVVTNLLIFDKIMRVPHMILSNISRSVITIKLQFLIEARSSRSGEVTRFQDHLSDY